MTTITRVSFCEKCFRENRPKTSQEFLVSGSTTNVKYIRLAARIGHFGYVPHIIRLVKAIGEVVVFEQVCSMNGCDISIWRDQGKWLYSIPKNAWIRGMTSLENWHAWVSFKDTGYEI